MSDESRAHVPMCPHFTPHLRVLLFLPHAPCSSPSFFPVNLGDDSAMNEHACEHDDDI